MRRILVGLQASLEGQRRLSVVHDDLCEHCPSQYPPDEEVEQILTWSRPDQLDTVFPCAWRRDKLCRGYCDSLGATQAEIETHFAQTDVKP